MEWARYLAGTYGTAGAVSALQFYEDVDWISADVRRTMVDYIRGVSFDDQSDVVDEDLGDGIDTLSDTPFEEHAKSLEYISTIVGDTLEYDLVPLRLSEDGSHPVVDATTGDSETDGD